MNRQNIPNLMLAGLVALLVIGLVPPLANLALSVMTELTSLDDVMTGYNVRASIRCGSVLLCRSRRQLRALSWRLL